ncbi:hypothetical protein AwWohl_08390 [Gammaproteobacteria bacterium]|nr:hypothetical protein AwWohl_08390 [Gammaproteobacteria bacterium]
MSYKIGNKNINGGMLIEVLFTLSIATFAMLGVLAQQTRSAKVFNQAIEQELLISTLLNATQLHALKQVVSDIKYDYHEFNLRADGEKLHLHAPNFLYHPHISFKL